MLRRFFSRFGGAGLDASGFKKTIEVNSDNGGGGDTPSGGILLTDIHYKDNIADFLASLPYNNSGNYFPDEGEIPVTLEDIFDADVAEFMRTQVLRHIYSVTDGLYTNYYYLDQNNVEYDYESGSWTLEYNVVDGEGIRTGEKYRIGYDTHSNKIDFVEHFD